MHFQLLADRADAIPTVARWHFAEWGHRVPDNSLQKTSERLRGQLNRDQLPLALLALDGDTVIGAAELKPHEMLSLYPDKQPWLGGVFVSPESRGKGVASQLALRIAAMASSLGAEQIYLQTTSLDGGLYARFGWRPIEQVRYRGLDVLVMEKKLLEAVAG
ncbi:MAG TPA: GNAT family N-acetyltransferase [Pirellulales bacterium]|jgi:predicted N-acetyltransferase YhbS|nr:GNAT family N-acetyltransferase [Pirellulales bacterium]